MAADTTWWAQHGEAVLTTIIGSVITLVVALAVYWRQKPIKRLASWIVVDVPLLTLSNLDVRVYSGDDLLQKPRVLVFRIQNTGREAIKADDFEGAIRIAMTARKVVNATTVNASDQLVPKVMLNQGTLDEDKPDVWTVEIDPLLLNPGEWFEVRCLVEGPVKSCVPNCRIAGMSGPFELLGHPPEMREPSPLRLFGHLVSVLYLGAIFMSAYALVNSMGPSGTINRLLLLVGLSLVSVFGAWAWMKFIISSRLDRNRDAGR